VPETGPLSSSLRCLWRHRSRAQPTTGADVGELGEREIELETVGRFGKRDGS